MEVGFFRFVDLAIPCNNKSSNAIGLMWYFLAREVLRLRGTISRELPWEVMPGKFLNVLLRRFWECVLEIVCFRSVLLPRS